jgi:hypothetical protein
MLPSSRRHVGRRRGAPGYQIETGPLTRGTVLSARPGAPPCCYLLARRSPWLHGPTVAFGREPLKSVLLGTILASGVSRAFLAPQHRRASCPARRDFAGGAFFILSQMRGHNHTNDRRLSAASARLSPACSHLPQMIRISLDKGHTSEVVYRQGCARSAYDGSSGETTTPKTISLPQRPGCARRHCGDRSAGVELTRFKVFSGSSPC